MLSTLAISWPAKEVVSHTFRAWKAARNFDLDGQGPLQRDERVWCCGFFFLSHGTPKIPSSLNKPVPGSKIAGKAKRGKSARVRIMVDLWQFSSASATRTILSFQGHIIFPNLPASKKLPEEQILRGAGPLGALALFLHADRNIAERVRLLPVDFYRHFSFHHAIQFHPVERIATRSMPHTRQLANVEAIPFPTSKHFQSIDKFSFWPQFRLKIREGGLLGPLSWICHWLLRRF